MSCCDGILKYLLFFFNLLFCLNGLALIIVGSLNLSGASSFSDLINNVESGAKTPQIFVIILGLVIFCLAGIGCLGAIRENRCMLLTFAILLLSIFIIQLAIGIYALVDGPKFTKNVEVGLQREFNKIRENPKIKKLFEDLEISFQCCGVRGFTDYLTLLVPVSESCCEDKANCRIRPNTYWKIGCAEALSTFSGTAGETLAGVAIGLSLLEILGAIFAFRLASKYK